MALAKVTTKGQVTIPLEVRQKLSLEAGSRIEFVLTPEGKFVIEPVHSSIRSLEGVFHRAGRQSVSVDEMEEAIAVEAGGAAHDPPAADPAA